MRGVTKTVSAAFLLAGCLLLGAQPAAAVLSNPSFEMGDTSYWNTVGNVSVTDSSFGVDPPWGSYQILLTTSGATTSETESAMGLASGTIQGIFDSGVGGLGSGPIEGAAIQQTFDVTQPGDYLTFSYNFLTNESVPEPLTTDFVWWHLDRPGGTDPSGVIAHANETGFYSSGTSYTYETGYQSVTLNFSKAGTYTITLGIHDVEDTYTDSAALFDGFWLRRTPEPDSFLLLAAGLLGLAFHARWARRSGARD